MSNRPKKNMLPDYLKKYFWDVDFQELNLNDSWFIIDRLLELADETEVKYMLHTFTKKEIINVVKGSRTLSTRSKNFWGLFFNIKEKNLCTPKQYPTPYGNYYHY